MLLPVTDARAAAERVCREERAAVLASLLRRVRDFEAAEDALHDAFVSALATWRERGVPERPGAWLLTTATNRATDAARRQTLHAAALTDLSQRSRAAEVDPNEASDVEDDRLRLIFTCCHPALDLESRVALTLQAVGGLTAAEIARAMLVTEAAMVQRLVRVKRKIRDAGIPYEVPAPEARRERLDGVREVVYLIFNEGHQATASDALHRVELAEEAIRLARLLRELIPGDAECGGLLALLLVTDARRGGRLGPDGELVPLDEQDRARWDGSRIRDGVAVLDEAMQLGRPGPYQIQAAISALHSQAPSWERTDWRQIAALYDALLRHDASPVVELNRAVAISMASGPEAGLAILARLAAVPSFGGYQPFHAARADLLRRAGRVAESATAYDRAIELSRNGAERRFLARRRDDLTGASGRSTLERPANS